MDNVLFIVPPPIRYVDYVEPGYNVGTARKKNGTFASVLTEMPLGVLAMSSYIKKHAPVRTKLIDFNVILNRLEGFEYSSFAELFRHHLSMLELEPTIVGISSLFTPSYQNILDIGEICRSLFPWALVIAGGGIPTNMYREVFEASSSFHALCFGEGEKPLLDLVKSTDRLQHFEDNPAWITRDKVEAGQTFQHDYIYDLDEIPFLDYDLLEASEYGMNPLVKTYAGVDNKQNNFHVMTSRGCPHRCCFCSSHTVHGRQMRYYSLERVKEDFTRLSNQYHAKTFVFQDDHLANIKKRTLKILEIIKELKVTAVFQNGIALYTLSRELLEAYKSVGVNQMVLAVESGSERVLKEIIHKPLNLGIVKRVADDCRDLDIYTDVNVLLGFPGETKQDIEDTSNFLKTINANWFRVVVATPLVGSEMFDICMKKGYLKHGYIDCNYKKAVVDTEEFTAEWIQERAYILNLELNFVCNSDMKFGRYRTALKGFENAIKAKADHAFAFFYAAKCNMELGKLDQAGRHMHRARTIFEEDARWRKYAEIFDISTSEY